MRIIIPIKQVPETNAVKMDETTGTMIRDGVESIVNPLDLYGIELAIQLREQHGGEVTAVTMGPASAVKSLREAISMGCDSAVLVSDRAFAGSDTWVTAYVLAAAIRKLGETALIICGERATDGDTGQVGPATAAFLKLPVVSYVSKVAQLSEKRATVHRLIEEGYEVLDVELPAVLTVVKEVAEPRLPTLRGKRRARTEEIPVWGPVDLSVDPGDVGLKASPTRVVKIFRPKVARECKKVMARDDDSIQAGVEGLIEFLRKKELV